VRLDVPAVAQPSASFPVTLEVDDLPEAEGRTVRVRVELLSSVEGQKEEQPSDVVELRGDRDRRLYFSATGPRGGLLFRPEVKDWAPTVDLSASSGPTKLRLRLLDEKNQPLEDEKGEPLQDVKVTVLDDTPPEGVKLRAALAKAVRGKALPLEASGHDPESGIRKVVFFMGKPLPGDKLPPGADPLPGELVKAKGKEAPPGPWAGTLVVPSDQRSPLVVSVQFTNGVGLTKTGTLLLDVVDPPPAALAKGKKAGIVGTVVEGDLLQNELEVTLTDATTGKVKAKTKTDNDGKYAFKDLDPGEYRVSTVKIASGRRADEKVELKEGEEKRVPLTLYVPRATPAPA
jgi:hypothetical protein